MDIIKYILLTTGVIVWAFLLYEFALIPVIEKLRK